MSGLSEAILIKIRESERDGLEKHRKIAEYEKIIKELQFLDKYEEEKITSLESKIDQAENDLMARKVELSKLDIRTNAVLEVIEQKRDEAVTSQQTRLQKLREMTEIVDGGAEITRSYVSKYSIIADKEEVEARRKVRQEKMEKERQEMEVLMEELSEYEAAIAKRSSLEAQIDKAEDKLSETSELRDHLEAEASGLMQELTRVQTQRNTESQLAKEVKLLKQKVCVLMQVHTLSILILSLLSVHCLGGKNKPRSFGRDGGCLRFQFKGKKTKLSSSSVISPVRIQELTR